MNHYFKKIALALSDAILVMLALAAALLLRFDGRIPTVYLESIWQFGWLFVLTGLIIFKLFNMYISLWKYASIDELITVVLGVSTYCAVFYILAGLMPYNFPRSIYVLQWFILMAFVGGLRFFYRALDSMRRSYKKHNFRTNVLVIGAGQAGSMVIKELFDHPELGKRPVAAIDQDPAKAGTLINTIPVVGDMSELHSAVSRYYIEEIIISMPSAPETVIKEIITQCKDTGCRLRRLPGVYKILDGTVMIQQIQDVKIEDLLGRPQVCLDTDSICSYITNQVVMVTGAGGSIGSELCRQVARFKPSKLVMLDINENNLYELQLELMHSHPDVPLNVLIGSVRDSSRINQIFGACAPQVVFHAAAHKHVPLMEASPAEAIKNNVFGTINVAEAADRHKCKKFVFISTDKAVNPTNVMGASKRAAELAIQQINRDSDTEFVAVRFGNVLGSSGSVIPIFTKQIARGGPVTVTHPDVTRYFMTIPEAVQLVIQAGAIARGGEIFVLDMGEPVKIVDLAKDLIRLSGFKPDEDVKLEFTGLRPGEKLFEELHLDSENVAKTHHDAIFVLKNSAESNSVTYREEIEKLKSVFLKVSDSELRKMLRLVVPTYCPEKEKEA